MGNGTDYGDPQPSSPGTLMQRRSSECGSDSSTDSSQEGQPKQCCLTAGVLFLSCCLLIVAMGGLLVASAVTDGLVAARTPCLAVLGMALFLAFISGLLAAFVERKLHERYAICRLVYCVTCVFCLDAEERRAVFRRRTRMEMSDSSPDSAESGKSGPGDSRDELTPHVFSRTQRVAE